MPVDRARVDQPLQVVHVGPHFRRYSPLPDEAAVEPVVVAATGLVDVPLAVAAATALVDVPLAVAAVVVV